MIFDLIDFSSNTQFGKGSIQEHTYVGGETRRGTGGMCPHKIYKCS